MRPRVVVMKQKTKLLMKNSDKILHNVHTHPGKTGNSVANIAQPKFKKKIENVDPLFPRNQAS